MLQVESLIFRDPFEINEWLNNTNGYEARDLEYYRKLNLPENLELKQALWNALASHDNIKISSDKMLEYIQDCDQIYQKVTSHPDDLAILYRLKELDTKVELALVSILKAISNDTSEDNIFLGKIFAIDDLALSVENMSADDIYDKMINHALFSSMLESDISDDTKESIRSSILEFSHRNEHTASFFIISDLRDCYDQHLKQHPIIRDFLGAELLSLQESGGIYTLGQTGHTLDKNMLWVYALIKSQRTLSIRSPIYESTIFRQSMDAEPYTPSAFANEIVALISVGYDVNYVNGCFELIPPYDVDEITLSQLQKSMENIDDKLFVLNQLSDFISLVQIYEQSTELDNLAVTINVQVNDIKIQNTQPTPTTLDDLDDLAIIQEIEDQMKILDDYDFDNLNDIERFLDPVDIDTIEPTPEKTESKKHSRNQYPGSRNKRFSSDGLTSRTPKETRQRFSDESQNIDNQNNLDDEREYKHRANKKLNN